MLQAQVDAQFQMANGLDRVRHVVLEGDIPVSPGILREATSLDDALDGAREPQPEPMPAVRDRVIFQADIGRFEGYPAERALAATPFELDLLKLALACHVLGTDLLDGIRR